MKKQHARAAAALAALGGMAPEMKPIHRRRAELTGMNAALEKLYRGHYSPNTRPIVFLDFDDVLCVNKPYGGYDVFSPAEDRPPDIWGRLWHPPAVQTLRVIVEEYQPRFIITTSWLRLTGRQGFEALFRRTGLEAVADALHDAWEAPQDRGASRLQAIEKWLAARYEGEPLVVLDDVLSGTGLAGSRLDSTGCVVLCEVGVGLHAGHLPEVRRALGPRA